MSTETITQRSELPEFLEAEGKLYLGELRPAIAGQKAADLSKVFGPQFVAGQDPLQQRAVQLGTQGIDSFKPFLTAAQAATGPQAFQPFMSPYQRDVIDASLQEFDLQAQRGLGALSDQAVRAGAFGGARQGVAEAEYRSASDRNRAALQAQLLQQGFGQAQNLAAQAFGQQQALAAGSCITGSTGCRSNNFGFRITSTKTSRIKCTTTISTTTIKSTFGCSSTIWSRNYGINIRISNNNNHNATYSFTIATSFGIRCNTCWSI